jgi:hypothetical protein
LRDRIRLDYFVQSFKLRHKGQHGLWLLFPKLLFVILNQQSLQTL